MPIRILLRRGNANTWISANPVLSAGEVGVETDTGLFKIGDSSNTWANLTYFYPGTDSTSNILEGTNLYFTNTRSIGALTAGFGVSIDANGLVTANVGAVGGALTTSDVAEGTNLYFSNGRVYSNVISLGYSTNNYVNVRLNTKANVSDLTTANVAEVNNLYFTNSRSIGALTAGDGIVIAANGRVTGLGAVTSVAGQIGAISNAQLAAAVSTANIVTTTQVAEGANLYFTNTRAIGALTSGAGISIAANGRITGLGAVTSVVGQIGDVSSSQIAAALNGQNVTVNDLTVQGDFTVNGNITTLNTASLNIEDKNIVLANGAANGAAADGAGFSISGAYANLTYINSVDRFSINKYLDVIGNTVLTNANTTTHLSEGNNLYFTNARVYANVIELAYAPNAYVNTRLLTKANVADLTTTNVAEGNNQYYTNVRVQQYLGDLAGNIIPTSNQVFSLGTNTRRFKDLFLSGTTIALGETLLKSDPSLGGFTISSSNVEQPGAITFSVAANSVLISDIVTTNVITVDSITSNNWSGIYTGNVVETSGNLYFTNSRAVGALTAGRGVEIAANGVITTLYNIEKIAGIANGVVSNIQLAYAIQDTPLLNTANIIEGGNLYYTNARVAANVATLGYAQNTYVNARLATKTDVTALNIYSTNAHVTAVVNLLQTTKANNEDVTNLTTSNIPEGANLYFTNNRAVSAIYAGQAIIIDSNGMISANVSQIGGGTITSIAGVNSGAVANDQIAAALSGRNISLVDLSASGQTNLNDLTVNGDLVVNGTTTFINSTEVSINDLNLVLANNAASPEVADGAGISISGAYANLTYISQFDRFNVNKYLDVLGNTVLTNANTTTHLSEGTNLYFTNTRAVAAFNPGSGIIISSNGYIAINQSNVGAISSISSTPAAINFIVGSVGQSYLIDPYFGFNPQLKVYAGQTVAFDLGTGLSINNHPFTIKSSYGGTNVTTGLTLVTTNGVTLSGSSAQGNVSGRMLWRVPPTLGGNSYVYQSTSNAQVFGNIFVIPQQYFSGLGSEVSANGLVTNTGVIQVAGANSYVTNIQLAVAVNDLLNTSNIAEGSNLYYTNTRVNAYIHDTIFEQIDANTTNVNYSNVLTLFNLGGTIFHPQGDNGFSINKDVDIGNSSIRAFNFNTGATHEEIVIGLSHNDQFTHGIGAYGSTADSNLIIAVGGSNADILFKKDIGIPFEVSDGTTIATITRTGNIIPSGSFIGSLVGTVSSLSNFTTSNLTEGTNLYFSNSRAIGALTAGPSITIAANGLISSTATGSGNGDVLTVNGANGNVVLYHTSVVAPANATLGALWYNNVYGNLFVYVNDGTSNVWIEIDDSGAAANTYLTTSLLTKANVSDLTTANVTEVNNLYYTNTRVQGYLQNISGNIVPSVTEVYSLGTPSKKFKDLFLSGNTIILGDTKIESSGDGTISIKSTNAEVTSSISFASNGLITSEAGVFTTANVAEQGNLYFTNARARAVIENGTGVFYNPANGYINIGQDVRPTSSVEFHDLLVTGNVTFAGNAAVINTTSLSVTDNMIYLNESKAELVSNVIGDGANVTYYLVTDHTALVGQMLRVTSVNPSSFNIPYTNIIAITANSITVSSNVTDTYVSGGNAFIKAAVNPDLGFSGGYNDGTYHHAGLFRDASDGLWKFFENYGPEPDSNVYIDTSHPTFRLANLQITNVIGNVTGRITSLDNHNTSNLVEGSNLYYTNTRAIFASIPAVTQINVTTPGMYYAMDSYSGNNPSIYVYAGETISFNLDVSGHPFYIRESSGGSNYDTGLTHVDVDGTTSIGSSAQGKTTGKLFWKVPYTLAGNTYVYQCGIHSGMVGSISLQKPVAILNTSDINEGSNLYFTNARVYANISPLLNTSTITEGSNLYFTNTRTIAALTAGSGIVLDANGLITSVALGGVQSVGGQSGNISNAQLACSVITSGVLNTSYIPESGNVYFTNTRAVSALTAGTGISIAANGRLTVTVTGGGGGGGGGATTLDELSDVVISGPSAGQVLKYDGANFVNEDIILTTANIAEEGNLYFTNSRVVSALSVGVGLILEANGYIHLDPPSGNIGEGGQGGGLYYTSNSSPSGAPLGSTWYKPDQGNIYVRVNDGTSNVWLEIDLPADISPADLTTANVIEVGSNVYFTNARTVAALTPGQGIAIAANGMISSTGGGGDVTTVNGANGNVILTTANIAESGNLYFTNVRSRQAFTAGSGIVIGANGLLTVTVTGGGGGGGGGISSLDRSFNFPGELYPQNGTSRWYPQYSYTINTIRARVSNAPVGNDINLNIRKNGNIVATTSILDGLDRSSINTSIPVAYEDYITVDITSVGNAAKGTDLVVSILYSG